MIVIATMAIPGITFVIPNFVLMSRLGLVDHRDPSSSSGP